MRGNARYAEGDVDGALADLEMALRIAPPNWPSRREIERAVKQLKEARGRK